MADAAFDKYTFEIIASVVGFIGGRFWERREKKKDIINENVEKLIDCIGLISKDAIQYYTLQMDVRETSAQTALIGRSFKLLHRDLHSLCLQVNRSDSDFASLERQFHAAVTSEPFGSESIVPLDASDNRILLIQNAEDVFVRSLRNLKK